MSIVNTLLIVVGVIAVALALLALSRLRLRLTIDQNEFDGVFTLLGVGPYFDQRSKRFGLSLFGLRLAVPIRKKRLIRFSAAGGAKRAGRAMRRAPARLALRIGIKTVRAVMRMTIRLFSYLKFSVGDLEVEPVFGDPAVAGMAYGWTRAVYGIFPGLAETVAVTPSFSRKHTAVSVRVELSLLVWQLTWVMFRFLIDLPIKEILRLRKAKRGG